MKSIKDLQAIRERALDSVNMRKDQDGIRIVVGMATCGIAAGARPVMLKFVEEINRRHLQNVSVSQTGCIGMCRFEPLVEVLQPGKEKVTYVHVDPDKVSRIVTEHMVNGNPVKEFTMNAAEGK